MVTLEEILWELPKSLGLILWEPSMSAWNLIAIHQTAGEI